MNAIKLNLDIADDYLFTFNDLLEQEYENLCSLNEYGQHKYIYNAEEDTLHWVFNRNRDSGKNATYYWPGQEVIKVYYRSMVYDKTTIREFNEHHNIKHT